MSISVNLTLSSPQYDIFTSTKDINLMLSGVGGGKTTEGGLLSANYILKFPHVRGFIGANTYEQLANSTLIKVRDFWKEYFKWENNIHYVVGIKPPDHFNLKYHNFDDYHNIISFANGAVVFKGSLERYLVHEGKEFGWAILDETKDTREEAVKEVILARLRQFGIYLDENGELTTTVTPRPFMPLYIVTTPAKVDWINEWFNIEEYESEILELIYDKNKYFKKEVGNKFITISSTYHNQAHLPPQYIQNIYDGNSKENAERMIYGNPFLKAGGEFYSSFDRMRHVKDIEFIEHLPIHISFDFNVAPYITMLLFQIKDAGSVKEIRCFDEICLSNPDNKTDKLCRYFLRKYRDKINGLFYYGDATGRANRTDTDKHNYDIIKRELRLYLNNYSNRVPYANPFVNARRDFINEIFEEKYPLRALIDRKCKKTIGDFEFVQEDENGGKLKKKVKDPISGQTYEKYGHTSDAWDYFYCQAFKKYFKT